MRRATALHQPDQRVQIDPAFTRELLGQTPVEAGPAQALPSPADDLGGPRAGAGVCSASKVHACLAPEQDPFLPSGHFTARPGGRDVSGGGLGALRDGGVSVNAAAEVR